MKAECRKFDLFINGESVQAANKETFPIINPATGKVVAEVAKGGKEDILRAVRAARQSFDSGVWSELHPKKRAEMLFTIANKIAEHAQELCYLEGISSGATIKRTSFYDIGSTVDLFNTMAKLVLEHNYSENLPIMPYPGPAHNLIWREPIGVCAGITPWNFPILLNSWKIAPAIAMGNSIVLKPATSAPLTTILLAQIINECGMAPGVINVVPGPGASIGEALITHPDVNKVAFTGSTDVGKRIMELAAGSIKKVTLELGGKSPVIFLDDADLSIAIPGVLFGVFLHSGQCCMAGTRLFVPDSIYDKVIELLAAQTSKIRLGNPLEPSTDMGPLISQHQLDIVLDYIKSGIEQGARLVCGGKRTIVNECEDGYFIEPTIFADVKPDMRIAQEEIFGPVLSVFRYSDVEEAIQMANDTQYGLAAAVWTQDVNKAYRIARRIKAGTVWVNDSLLTRNDAPFGGYKQSGIGRELGKEVLEEYSQVKHVHTSMTLELERRSWYSILFPEA